jgi:hypothetical protein
MDRSKRAVQLGQRATLDLDVFARNLILTARRDPYPEVAAFGRGFTLRFATYAGMPDISIYLVWYVASGVEGEVWQGSSIWQVSTWT